MVEHAGQRFEVLAPPGSLPGSQIQFEMPSQVMKPGAPTETMQLAARKKRKKRRAKKRRDDKFKSQSSVISTAQLEPSSSVLETSRGKTKPVGIETRRSSGVPRKLPNRASKNNQILTEKNVYQLKKNLANKIFGYLR